jgi:hypothetical protein
MLCVGFLRFLRGTDTPNRLAHVGERLGVIDYAHIPDKVPIAESWDEVLEMHRLRGEAGADIDI